MSEPENRDDSFGDLNALMFTLSSLDERGLVVSLGAFAEEVLGEVLEAFMIDNASARMLITGFNAPFGSFSARIRGCHALGLITDDQFSDLERLRRMRNKYAHSWKKIDYSDPEIESHITALSFPYTDDDFPETMRDKLTHSISFLLVELRVKAVQIKEKDKRARLIGSRLMAGPVGTEQEQLEKAQDRIRTISEELRVATGEKKRFLEVKLGHWQMMLKLVELPITIRRLEEEIQEAKALQRERKGAD